MAILGHRMNIIDLVPSAPTLLLTAKDSFEKPSRSSTGGQNQKVPYTAAAIAGVSSRYDLSLAMFSPRARHQDPPTGP
jgi:hypothetical protein